MTNEQWIGIETPPEHRGTYLVVDDNEISCKWHFGHWDGESWLSGDAMEPITPTHWKSLGLSPSGDTP